MTPSSASSSNGPWREPRVGGDERNVSSSLVSLLRAIPALARHLSGYSTSVRFDAEVGESAMREGFLVTLVSRGYCGRYALWERSAEPSRRPSDEPHGRCDRSDFDPGKGSKCGMGALCGMSADLRCRRGRGGGVGADWRAHGECLRDHSTVASRQAIAKGQETCSASI